MAGYRFWLQGGAAILTALAITQIGWAQVGPAQSIFLGNIGPIPGRADTSSSCKVYSLADIGDDGKLGKWVAETIPEMIQPASWKQAGAKLSYFAPSKILVVNNTPAVHAQVEEFLASLRKAMPQGKRQDGQIVPAQFVPEDAPRPISGVQSGPTGYPVPTSPVGPKHLFHFIIRYEGEGIIDSNVSKFAKSLIEANKENGSGQANFSYPPVGYPVASAPMTVRGSFDPPNSTGPATRSPAPQMPPADAPAPSSGSTTPVPSSIPAPPPFPAGPPATLPPPPSGSPPSWRVP